MICDLDLQLYLRIIRNTKRRKLSIIYSNRGLLIDNEKFIQ